MSDIPQFGTEEEGVEYTLRPGAYALFSDESGRLGVAQTPVGLYLPGGGQEAGETLEQAAVREVGEECGLLVEVGEGLGEAFQFVVSQTYGLAFRKHCHFFVARVTGTTPQTEKDHELVWLGLEEALSRLTDGSHRWALQRYCERL